MFCILYVCVFFFLPIIIVIIQFSFLCFLFLFNFQLISRLTSNSVNLVKVFKTNHVCRAMCSATNKNVIFEEKNNKGIITLNRPKALNAINLDMVRLVYCDKNVHVNFIQFFIFIFILV